MPETSEQRIYKLVSISDNGRVYAPRPQYKGRGYKVKVLTGKNARLNTVSGKRRRRATGI